MGFLKKMRAKSGYASAMETYEKQLSSWESERRQVDEMLYIATNLDDVYEQSAEAGFSVRLKSGEHVLLAITGSGLVEPRVSQGQYQGGSTGVSFRVTKGVRFRVGQHQGTFQPGPETQKFIDEGGDLYITTERVMYTSPSRNREWSYPKAVDVFHSDNFVPNWGVTYIGVTNRQKTSGFAYPMDMGRQVRDRLQLAFAVFDGTVEEMAAGLKEQQRELRNERPVEPTRPTELDG